MDSIGDLLLSKLKETDKPQSTRHEDSTERVERVNSLKEIQQIYLRSLQILSSIAKSFYLIGEYSSYEFYMIEYVYRIERVYSQLSGGNSVLINAYLLMANLYVELDQLSKARILYEQCLNLLQESDKNDPDYLELEVVVNYNLGCICYVNDEISLAKEKIGQALKINEEIRNNKISEQTANIYETLGEIEIENHEYVQAFEHLQKTQNIRNEKNISDKAGKIKVNILLDFIYKHLEKENEKKTILTGQGLVKLNKTKNEKELDDLLKFIRTGNFGNNYNESKKKKKQDNHQEIDLDELEKFFLFMSKLKSFQIDVLNDTQPSDLEKNIKMPIYFGGEFKDCLSHHQRISLNNMKLMSLKRNQILKNPLDLISFENLNYDAFYGHKNLNNLSSIKNYFVVNQILKNWEVKNDDLIEIRTPNSRHDMRENNFATKDSAVLNKTKSNNLQSQNSGMAVTLAIDPMDKKDDIVKDEQLLPGLSVSKEINLAESKIKNSNENVANNMQIKKTPPKTTFSSNVDKNNLQFFNENFNKTKSNTLTTPHSFVSFVKQYYQKNRPDDYYLLDEKMLEFLSKNLDNNEIQALYENPEYIHEVIEEFQKIEGDDDMPRTYRSDASKIEGKLKNIRYLSI